MRLLASLLSILIFSSSVAADVVLLDFYSDSCEPCRTMAPVVAGLEREGYRVERVDVARRPDLASQYGVNAIPAFIVLRDGRPAGRLVGAVPAAQLRQLLGPVPSQKAASPAPVAPRQRHGKTNPSPAQPRLVGSVGSDRSVHHAKTTASPAQPAAAATGSPIAAPADELALNLPSSPAPAARSTERQKPADAERWTAAAAGGDATPPATRPAADTNVPMRSAVRLVCDASGARAYGSGSIIDGQPGESLVLTCAHLFSDVGRGYVLTVEWFGDAQPVRMSGELLAQNRDADVALVRVKSPRELPASPVAPRGFALRRGMAGVSIGCDRGERPASHPTSITAINRYLGPANIECAGQPQQGRSGGGLFSADGQLIGVCTAADPSENRVLYAGLTAIHQLLDAKGLAHLYQRPAARTPEVVLASTSKKPAPTLVVPSPEELGIERASPEFLTQLAKEQSTQDARSLTRLAGEPVAVGKPDAVGKPLLHEVVVGGESLRRPEAMVRPILVHDVASASHARTQTASASRWQPVTPPLTTSALPVRAVRHGAAQ